MDIKGTISGLTSRVSPWGWAAGGVLLIGLVFLLTKGSGSTSTTATTSAGASDLLNQLQSAVDSLVNSQSNPPSESVDGDHPDIVGGAPWTSTSIGIGGLTETWFNGKYVPGVGGTPYANMAGSGIKPGILRRGSTRITGDTNRVQVEARSVSTALLGSSNNRVVSR